MSDFLSAINFGFEPIVGLRYYLYRKQNRKDFISVCSPQWWNRQDLECLGCYQLDINNVWERIS